MSTTNRLLPIDVFRGLTIAAMLILGLFISTVNVVMAQKNVNILTVPAGNEFTQIHPEGTTILPSGRFLTPAGHTIRITNDPFGMALSPDGRKSVALHNGVFTIVDLQTMNTIRVPSYDKKIK